MSDIDQALARLGSLPVHPRLDTIEAQVLDRVSEPAPRRGGFSMGALTIAVATTMGVAAAGVPEALTAAPTLSPFGPNSPLAPSTLLAGAE